MKRSDVLERLHELLLDHPTADEILTLLEDLGMEPPPHYLNGRNEWEDEEMI